MMQYCCYYYMSITTNNCLNLKHFFPENYIKLLVKKRKEIKIRNDNF